MSEGERERVSDFNCCGPKIGELDSTGLTGLARANKILTEKFSSNDLIMKL